MEKPFSAHLKEYQKAHSYTNREMADILEISERMYSYYEKGEYDGNPSKVKKYLLKLSGNLQENRGANEYQTTNQDSDLKDKLIKLLEERVELLIEKCRKDEEKIRELEAKLSKRGLN